MTTATAISHPNIAFIKYWGNRDQALRLPASGSISMNLAWLTTRTRVTFDVGLPADQLFINGQATGQAALARASRFLDIIRQLAGVRDPAHITSENNFPTGAGIASSASGFAALTLAATAALGIELGEAGLSRLARLGSGSACRSIPPGFVEWQAGKGDVDSYAFSIAPPDHWDLVDCVAVVESAPKPTGSTEGHALADTSPLQAARLAGAPQRLDLCRRAIQERDFEALARVVELDSSLMHAVMQTSTPPLLYWSSATVAVLQSVPGWRAKGLPACFTMDAGPNVHVLTQADSAEIVAARLRELPGVRSVLVSPAGEGARLETAPVN